MRLALWTIAVVLFVLGCVFLGYRFQTRFIVFSFIAVAFFCYAALLQDGTKTERIADEATRVSTLSLEPLEGVGSLIIFRFGLPSKFLGMDFAINGQTCVQLKSPRFTRLDIPAGTYELSGAFCSPFANKNLPATLGIEIETGKFTVVGVAVGLPEKWRWWRLGSKANWRDQIHMTIAPEAIIVNTMEYLLKVPMVLPDLEFSHDS